MRLRQIMAAALFAGILSSAHAMDMSTLQKVVPLPNLMMLTLQQAAPLQLSPAQQLSLKQWAEQHLSAQNQLAAQIVQLEQQLRSQILADASAATVRQTSQALETPRAALIEMRRQCVAQLKAVLTPVQWQQLLQKLPME